jgi:glycosyltransferase involved in cell wall biosynthesis
MNFHIPITREHCSRVGLSRFMPEQKSLTSDVILILLTYNHEDCIEESVTDILQQSMENFLLVVIDDASTDSTWDIVEKFEKLDDRVVALRNQNNKGGAENFKATSNFVLASYPNASYFSWIGPDDRYEYDWLAKLHQTLERDDQSSIAQSYCIYDFGNEKVLRMYEDLTHDESQYVLARKIQNGYGQLFHGLWKRTAMELFCQYSMTDFETFFKLESFSICYLFKSGNFRVVPEALMTKQKFLSSAVRYPNDRLYGDISLSFPYQFVLILKLLPRLLTTSSRILLITPLVLNLKIAVVESFKFRVINRLVNRK